MNKLIFCFVTILLSSCGVSGGFSFLTRGVTLSSVSDAGTVYSGFIAGTATSDLPIGVSLDGETAQSATGTHSWKFALPTGSANWKPGSRHTITVGILEGTTFSPTATITVTRGKNMDFNGDGYADLAVGAYNYDNGTAGDGGVYIFSGGSAGISSQTVGTPTLAGNPSGYESFGKEIAVGDINADGYADLAVGATNYVNGGVYLYYGSESGIPSQTATTPTLKGKLASGTLFGYSLAIGDINGDGYDDLAVGTTTYSNGTPQDGGVYLFNGSSNGISSQTVGNPNLVGKAGGSSQFGCTLAIGDLNGDGYADLAVGALRYNSYDGGVYLFPGASSGISNRTVNVPTLSVTASSTQYFGTCLAIGDINADSFADLVISAHQYNNGAARDGAVYVLNGGSSGIASQTLSTPTIKGKASAVTVLGRNVSLGDLNGDGYADLAVSAPSYDDGSGENGAVYIYNGGRNGISDQTAGTPTFTSNSTILATTSIPLSLFDLNGNGYADLVIGASVYDNGGNIDGGLFILDGSSQGLSPLHFETPTIKGKSSSSSEFGIALSK